VHILQRSSFGELWFPEGEQIEFLFKAAGFDEYFYNKGESFFGLKPGKGGIAFVHPENLNTSWGMPDVEGVITSLAYFPPSQTLKRRGQMFCFGNMHWMADCEAWEGGSCVMNSNLVLNILASSAVLASPEPESVPTLKELSRMAIRGVSSKTPYIDLDIPSELKEYIACAPELAEYWMRYWGAGDPLTGNWNVERSNNRGSGVLRSSNGQVDFVGPKILDDKLGHAAHVQGPLVRYIYIVPAYKTSLL